MQQAFFALAILQAPAVQESSGLSPDAKWILIAVGTAVVMLGGFLGKITFALVPSAREALQGISLLPAAINGVKDEMREIRNALGTFKIEITDDLKDLANEVRDRRVSKMSEATAVALAVATGTFELTDSDEIPQPSQSSRGRTPTGSMRAIRVRSSSSPSLEEYVAPSERRR